MRIGDREIGPGADVYIIAELGVNHDGSEERALALTDAAARAGADAVKLQVFRADLLMSRAARLAAYQAAAGEADPLEMLRRLELPARGMSRVIERAHERGLHAVATVFSVELVREAEGLAWDAYKTASPDIVHRPLLEALAGTGRPLVVSTGASTVEEVTRAVDWVRPARARLALLQCVSAYPCPRGMAALEGIAALAGVFLGPVGYSDHTRDTETGAEAVRRGARVLEKHLTWDRSAAGPDHAASLDEAAFADYVRRARRARAVDAGGTAPLVERVGAKRVLPIEEDVRRASRQSIVTRRALPAGHRIRAADVTFKRPGTGLEPWRIDDVISAATARGVEEDVPLTEDDVVIGGGGGPGRPARGVMGVRGA